MPRMTWSRRALAVAVAAASAAASVSTSPVAHAQSNDRGRDILKAAIVSGDLSVLARLSPSDKVLVQKAFQAELRVADNSGKSSSGTLSTAAAKAAGLTSAAAASRCWYNYHYSEATAFGIHVGSAWMQLNWCGNGSSVSNYGVDPYGAQGENGFSASASSPSIRSVGWEVRAVVVFSWSALELSTSNCGQLRGGATGLTKAIISCNMS
jgi:hypothetical protein